MTSCCVSFATKAKKRPSYEIKIKIVLTFYLMLVTRARITFVQFYKMENHRKLLLEKGLCYIWDFLQFLLLWRPKNAKNLPLLGLLCLPCRLPTQQLAKRQLAAGNGSGHGMLNTLTCVWSLKSSNLGLGKYFDGYCWHRVLRLLWG